MLGDQMRETKRILGELETDYTQTIDEIRKHRDEQVGTTFLYYRSLLCFSIVCAKSSLYKLYNFQLYTLVPLYPCTLVLCLHRRKTLFCPSVVLNADGDLVNHISYPRMYCKSIG